jgi:hypothetical protein
MRNQIWSEGFGKLLGYWNGEISGVGIMIAENLDVSYSGFLDPGKPMPFEEIKTHWIELFRGKQSHVIDSMDIILDKDAITKFLVKNNLDKNQVTMNRDAMRDATTISWKIWSVKEKDYELLFDQNQFEPIDDEHDMETISVRASLGETI